MARGDYLDRYYAERASFDQTAVDSRTMQDNEIADLTRRIEVIEKKLSIKKPKKVRKKCKTCLKFKCTCE